jgi:site-specific recombinase XerD
MTEPTTMEPPRLHIERITGAQNFEIRGTSIPLVAKANSFLEAVATRGLAVMTLRAYVFDLIIVLRWLTKTNRVIDQLEQADLLAFIRDEQARASHPCSINRRLTTLEGFFFFVTGRELPRGKGISVATPNCRGRGYDRYTGAHRIGPAPRRAIRVKTPKKLIEPLRVDQVRAFLDTLDRYRDLALVYLMLFCGLRSHEVLGLRIDDIDADNQAILVNGKGNKQRVVPLAPIACTTLGGYLRCERPRHCLTERVFVILRGSRRGSPMTLAGLRSLFRNRRQRLGRLHNANPHRFRHTYGTDMARAGIGISVLQQLMGHSDIETTLRYINLSFEDVAEEFQRASARMRERYQP